MRKNLTSADYSDIARAARIGATNASTERVAAILRKRALDADKLAKLAKLGRMVF